MWSSGTPWTANVTVSLPWRSVPKGLRPLSGTQVAGLEAATITAKGVAVMRKEG